MIIKNKKSVTILYVAFLLFLATVPYTGELHAQGVAGIPVKGIVTDSSGISLTRSSISIKDKHSNSITDENGLFEINAAPGDELLISHIGYETKTIKLPQAPGFLKVILYARSSLNDEVIVEANTGYQKVNPNEINGSVTVIDNKMLNQQTGTNILQRLNGVTNGLLFNIGKQAGTGSETGIEIRGLGTINGPRDPLIILDNFPYEGDISNINPNDVENITLLKDASAASIWGARAGNGVIVITTKRGKFNEKIKMDFNVNTLYTEPTNLFSIHFIPIEDYINVEANLFNRGYFNSTIENSYSRPPLTPLVSILLNRKNGLISSSDSSLMVDQLKAQDSRSQYSKYFQRWGLTQQYSLNIRGGSPQLSWLIAGNYNNVINTDRSTADKINVHIDNSFRPIKGLTINVGAYFTSSKSKTGMPSFSQLTTMNGRYVPYLNFVDDNGKALSVDRYRKEYIDTIGGGALLDWNYYPYEDYKHDFISSLNQEIITNLGLRYTLLPTLQLSANYQYQKAWGTTKRFADLSSFYLRDLINGFSQPNYSNGSVFSLIPMGDMQTNYGSDYIAQSFRSQIDYNKTWSDHSLNVIGGMDIRDTKSGGASGLTVYGYIDDPLSVGSVDFRNPYPTLINGSYSYIPGSPGIGSTEIDRFVSVYSNMLYTYLKRYSINGSFRKDASNVFGATTNNKWNPLWSSSIGWLVSNESFYKSNVLPYLRMRISYGYSGNLNRSATPLALSGASTNSQTQLPIQRISAPNNPSLRWEKSKQVNIGIDFKLKQEVITGSIEIYHKNGIDLYGTTPYDYTTWGRYGVITRNVANMKGKGLDLNIISRNIDRIIKWRTNLIYNYNTSITTKYYTDASKDLYGPNRGNIIMPVIGKPLYAITAYAWGGLNSDGDPQGYLDGTVSTDYQSIINKISTEGSKSNSLAFIGPSTPTHFGSLINNFSWKGVELSVNVMFKMGYYFFKNSFTSSGLIVGGKGYADFSQRWKAPGDEEITSIPKFVYPDYPQFNQRDMFFNYASVNVLKGEHVRLHYINISYSYMLNKKAANPITLQVYGNAANIGILWRYNRDHLDPDYPESYTPSRQYTMGLRLNF